MRRAGPPFPPVPCAPWQIEQFDAKTDLPAATLSAPFVNDPRAPGYGESVLPELRN
jgi:hypothetical protein